MAYFLKDERRQALVEEMVKYRISRDKAERIALIPEDEGDRHWYAHANVCNDTIGDIDHSQMAACACLWSFSVVAAINEEAHERCMFHEYFPAHPPAIML